MDFDDHLRQAADAAGRSCRDMERSVFNPQSDLERLALSFPTLVGRPGTNPWNAERLDRWASGPAPSSGAFYAATFVLAVYNNRAPWASGKFDVIAAMNVWDQVHRAAFVAWARAPWTE